MSRATELAEKAKRSLGGSFDREDCFYEEGLMFDMGKELLRLDRVNADLVEAMNGMLAEFNEQMPGIVHDELAAVSNARAALTSSGDPL